MRAVVRRVARDSTSRRFIRWEQEMSSLANRGLLLVIALLFLSADVRAQDEYVYLIKMFDCAHAPAQRSQTGFRVHGLRGIITALHGVADCQRVTASSRNGSILDEPLAIIKVDLDRDVALLSSPQINNSSDAGLEMAKAVSWESLGVVNVKGHPYGISSLETTLAVRKPSLTKLKNLLPPTALEAIRKRQSPNYLINVLNLQGNLLPGHSGAPILDSTSRVLAVANGGLKEGLAGISWAIPFQDIEWTAPDAKLSELAQADPNILFANAGESAGITSTIVGEDFCTQLSKLITASHSGFYSVIGDPTSNRAYNRFKAKLDLPGSTSGVVEPQASVTYNMYEADTLGKIESQFYNLVSTLDKCSSNWRRKEKKPEYTAPVEMRGGVRVLQPIPYRRVLFMEKGGSVVEVYYETGQGVSPRKRILWLTVYAPGKSFW